LRNYSSWTNRVLAADDFGSVQINVANIDPVTGKFDKTAKTYALCGFIRGHAEADEALAALVDNSNKQDLK
jgi:small subunit ribosomal protein S21e